MGLRGSPTERFSGAGSSVADSRATPSGLPSDAQTPANWPDLDLRDLRWTMHWPWKMVVFQVVLSDQLLASYLKPQAPRTFQHGPEQRTSADFF